MLQPPRNRFTLVWSPTPHIGYPVLSTPAIKRASLVFCPINWQDLEVVLSRDHYAVDQEVTAEIKCVGEAAEAVKSAYSNNLLLLLMVETLTNDWTYDASYWEFQADFQTYKVEGSVVSIGFIENSIKDLIEKNKGTKYDLPVPSTFTMEYSGVTLDKTNTITSVKNSAGMFSFLRKISPSNWIVNGVKSQTERSGSWVFTDYTGFHGRSLKTNQPTLTFFLGEIQFYLSSNYDGVKINLLHCRPITGGGFQVRTTLLSLTHSSRIGTLRYVFQDFNTYTFEKIGRAHV